MEPLTNSDVTVIIPAFDTAGTIGRSIESILNQAGGPPHLVVVDDGSTDATGDVARRLGAQVITGSRRGPGGARNTGIAAARTTLIAFCDADDAWPLRRLCDDLADFNAAASASTAGEAKSTTRIDILLGLSKYDTDDPSLLGGHHFDNDEQCALVPHFGAATMRADVFHRVGLIDADRRNYEDYEFFQRARDLGATVVEHRRIAQTRHLIGTSTSHQHPPRPHDLLAVLRESVRRRRDLDTRR
jgi:glycosyltransferase involved in cell wall biosynthesis